jgi:hypothetical protein
VTPLALPHPYPAADLGPVRTRCGRRPHRHSGASLIRDRGLWPPAVGLYSGHYADPLEERRRRQATIVEALGGALELWGVFPSGRYRIDVSGGKESNLPLGARSVVTTADSLVVEVETHSFADFVTQEDHFRELRHSGILENAHRAATAIKTRKCVLEMP